MLALKHKSCPTEINELVQLLELKLLLILFHYIGDTVFSTFNVQAQTVIVCIVFNTVLAVVINEL